MRKASGFFMVVKFILRSSWFNVLLVVVPISLGLGFAKGDSDSSKDIAVFIISCLAVIPLSKLLALVIDKPSLWVSQALAGLIHLTLGNASHTVDVIVSIIALTKGDLEVVQAALVGRIVSNLLFVLGMCFVYKGFKYPEQVLAASAAQLNSLLLTIGVIVIVLPTAYSLSNKDPDADAHILKLSRGAAVILLIIYGAYLVFQSYSHASLDDGEDITDIPYTTHHKALKKLKRGINTFKLWRKRGKKHGESISSSPTLDLERGEQNEEDEEVPPMNILMAFGLFSIIAALLGVNGYLLTSSIEPLVNASKMSKKFVGLIILPIIGNVAEHIPALVGAVEDDIRRSTNVAFGSSIQITLFVMPFFVILSWILGKPLTLLFHKCESFTLFAAVLIVNYAVQHGNSNWFKGLILMLLYVILGLMFWFEPGS